MFWKKKEKKQPETTLGKIWHFIWEEDSLASWLVNVVLAFVLVKFIVYPALGFLLGTSFPVVAVVSGSMEHDGMDFGEWWDYNNKWYNSNNVSESIISSSKFPDGFNKGDIMVLLGEEPKDIKEGSVIVYKTTRHPYPIIHRVTGKVVKENTIYFETKGDHNPTEDPELVKQDQVLGNAKVRVPMLGWIKIIFTELTGIGG